jgi:sugar phosphate isomerase/epimerase
MITLSAFADEIGPDLKLQMDVCQANGVRRIDVRSIDKINCSQMTLQQAGQYRRQMDDRGFAVACLGSPIGKITLTDDFPAHLELLKHCCQVAHAFGTSLIRIFSFYPPKGGDFAGRRGQVMDQMAAMVNVAESAGAVLLHENEKRIYGAKPDGVKDLFAAIGSKHFKGIFDPANFVEESVAPYDDAWRAGLGDLTEYFHIKDKVPGADRCVPAGQGAGQIDRIFADLKRRNWSGVMALEPHMKAAEQFSGFTGPELFAEAAKALKAMLEQAGLAYQ